MKLNFTDKTTFNIGESTIHSTHWNSSEQKPS
jgi:hypothetical protein